MSKCHGKKDETETNILELEGETTNMNNKRWLITFISILLPLMMLVSACGNNNNGAAVNETPKDNAPVVEPAAPADDKDAAWEAVLEAAKKS